MDIGHHLDNQFKLIRYLAEKEGVAFNTIITNFLSVMLEKNELSDYEISEATKRRWDELLLSGGPHGLFKNLYENFKKEKE